MPRKKDPVARAFESYIALTPDQREALNHMINGFHFTTRTIPSRKPRTKTATPNEKEITQ